MGTPDSFATCVPDKQKEFSLLRRPYWTVRFTVDAWLTLPDVAVTVIVAVPDGVVVLVYEHPTSVTALTALTKTSISLGVIQSLLRPAKSKMQAKGMNARAV